MRISILLGIGIPLLIIVFVAIIAILDVGITKEVFSPQKITLEQLYSHPENEKNSVNEDNYIGPAIRTIKIENKFIIERIEPISYRLCSRLKNNQNIQDLSFIIYINGVSSISYGSSKNQDITIKPGEIKTIEIKPRVYAYGTYNYTIGKYEGPIIKQNYTELLLFSLSTSMQKYKDCHSLVSENLDKAIKIKIE